MKKTKHGFSVFPFWVRKPGNKTRETGSGPACCKNRAGPASTVSRETEVKQTLVFHRQEPAAQH